jgi:hypothetical protein
MGRLHAAGSGIALASLAAVALGGCGSTTEIEAGHGGAAATTTASAGGHAAGGAGGLGGTSSTGAGGATTTTTTTSTTTTSGTTTSAGGAGGATSTGGAAPGCTFPSRDAALVLYYGTFKDDDGKQRPDLTYQLYNPGLDSVFTIGGGSIFLQGEPNAPGEPGTGAFKEYHEQCLRLAAHVGTRDVVACVRQRDDLLDDKGKPFKNPCEKVHVAGASGADDLAALWKRKLDLGWDYVAVDEIKSLPIDVAGGGTVTADFKDGGVEQKRFASALAKLAAAGYDRRVIAFFVPHDANGPPPSLPEYKDFLTSCRDHCRTTQVELYSSTTEVEKGAAAQLEAYAAALHGLGIADVNRHFSAIIAVGNDDGDPADPKDDWKKLDDADCDISPWTSATYGKLSCPALPKSGGIHAQLEAMHDGKYAKYWWGVGFYKLGAVRSKTGHWTKTDFVQSLAARVDWWAKHAPP